MAPKYAKDQPAGFSNRIERVAVVGVSCFSLLVLKCSRTNAIQQVSGQIGKYMTEALLSTGKHTITAITRKEGNSKIPEGCQVARVDYDNEAELVNALKGQQFLIISLAVTAPKDTQAKLIKAAAKAGVAWIMPNCYGGDIKNEKLMAESLVGAGVYTGVRQIEEEGVSSWVAMCCSFWYEFSLSMGPAWYGFDFANKKVTFVDDGKTQINTSTWEQCGRAIRALLSLKELPDDDKDKSPTLSNWRNEPLFISSFLASQRDMLDSVHRVLGTTDADWEVVQEGHLERYQRGQELMKQGQLEGFGMCLYTRAFYPNGDGNYEAKHGLANDVLGLPKEDFDDATKLAVDMAAGDFMKKRLDAIDLNKINHSNHSR